MLANNPGSDAYSPAQMALRVETIGVSKKHMPVLQLFTLGILAGAFIDFGGMFYTLVVTDPQTSIGITKMLGGMAFSLGLILVIVGGAELFTGNNLIFMAWADRKVTTTALLRNWFIVYTGNLIGSLGTAVAVYLSGILATADYALASTALKIAIAKTQLPFTEAFFRGLLCNTLVCFAVWMCFAARSVSGKVLVIIFPITAFVALGFEHCVANMYLIPVGMFAAHDLSQFSGQFVAAPSLAGFMGNIVPVTLGNVLGGTLVAAVYYLVYLKHERTKPANKS